MWGKTVLLLLHILEAAAPPPCQQGAAFPEADSSGPARAPGVASLQQRAAACCGDPEPPRSPGPSPGPGPARPEPGTADGNRDAFSQSQEAGPGGAGPTSSGAHIRTAGRQDRVRTSEPADPTGQEDRVRTTEPAGRQDRVRTSEPADPTGQEDRVRTTEPAGRQDRVRTSEPADPTGQEDRVRTTEPAGRQDRVRTSEPADPTGQEDRVRTTEPAGRQDRVRTTEPAGRQDRVRTSEPADPTGQEDRVRTSEPADPTGQEDRVRTTEPAGPAAATEETAGTQTPELPPSLTPAADSAPTGHMTVPYDIITTTVNPVQALRVQTPCERVVPVLRPPAELQGPNRAPQAVVGPDRKLVLPLSGGLLLNGSGSTDDRGVSGYSWEAVSGPPGLRLRDADRAVAMVTGLRGGRYTFRLTVSDQEGATDSALLAVRVQEARSLPPVAHASGSHVLTLPNDSVVLEGSVTDGDQTEVRYLWTRDSQSPAAGEVLFGSETRPSLYLAHLVEGTYLFQLRVTDAQGRSGAATATVEVRPEPGGGQQVELEMLVPVSQVSVAQRDTVVRQLAALIHVLDRDIRVRALRGRTRLSTVLRFSVQGPTGPVAASGLAVLLRKQLLRDRSDFLLFRVLRVDTVACELSCSGRGQCDPVTKQCSCDPFWTENLIRLYLGDGDSNCEWRVLYVVLSSFLMMLSILALSWTFICCSRRKRSKGRRRTRYTILDDMDEQERLELRPRFSLKHRSTEHNSSLMMSESELDSDQDAGRRGGGARAARGGSAFGCRRAPRDE
ncbi:dyslexia-associated protein KIAA0319 isoform 4-T4 [Anableps anableps]